MIRRATLDDLDVIWALRLKTSALLKKRGIDQWQSIFPTLSQFKRDIDEQSFYVLVLDQIVGMMSLKEGVEPTYDVIYEGDWHQDIPYVTIHRIAVDEAYRGQGHGMELLNFAKHEAERLGYHYLRIDTHQKNLAAIHRFTSFGFQYCGYILLDESHPTERKRLAYDLYWEYL